MDLENSMAWPQANNTQPFINRGTIAELKTVGQTRQEYDHSLLPLPDTGHPLFAADGKGETEKKHIQEYTQELGTIPGSARMPTDWIRPR